MAGVCFLTFTFTGKIFSLRTWQKSVMDQAKAIFLLFTLLESQLKEISIKAHSDRLGGKIVIKQSCYSYAPTFVRSYDQSVSKQMNNYRFFHGAGHLQSVICNCSSALIPTGHKIGPK